MEIVYKSTRIKPSGPVIELQKPLKIVCDDKIPFLKGALEAFAQVVYLPGNEISSSDVFDADALIVRTRTRCDRALLEGSSVRFIATATIGFDHIDTEWCEANGISWTNAPGCNSGSVQQYVASLLATMSKRFGFKCSEKTLGVVGVGNVGSKVAKIAAIMGFNVLLNDPPRARTEGPEGFVSLDRLLRESDIITCHVPLYASGPDATYHLFDESRLSAMRKDQILINSSRGEVVDNQALKNTLKEGRILAASLDVWENEPDIDTELMGLLFSATPHIAGYSLDGKANGTSMCLRAISEFFNLPCGDRRIEGLPSPDKPATFSIESEDRQAALLEAILHTYDIMEDDARLRNNAALFEHQRSYYPVRREFPFFRIKSDNLDAELTDRLKALGFRLF